MESTHLYLLFLAVSGSFLGAVSHPLCSDGTEASVSFSLHFLSLFFNLFLCNISRTSKMIFVQCILEAVAAVSRKMQQFEITTPLIVFLSQILVSIFLNV